MDTQNQAIKNLTKTWPFIKEECLSVLGSELHYQAMIYHCLREYGQVPKDQIGMNVKMWIDNPVSALFKKLDKQKQEDYQGGFEPIPDIVLFSSSIHGDWRRRNRENTLKHMLLVIEVKASERESSRLRPGEIIDDIKKLAAHREEVIALDSNFYPVMMIIDSAPDINERMTEQALLKAKGMAESLNVGFLYASPENDIFLLQK
ncbi:hypothetical protein [Desulfobacula sp.]|uniref:hypothetical protein n=1 Tax=Desulfobacula sp. TaxID=2593537 RepID=UPI00271541AE|nr:hypothetical protein [Desulfobacula sp.]